MRDGTRAWIQNESTGTKGGEYPFEGQAGNAGSLHSSHLLVKSSGRPQLGMARAPAVCVAFLEYCISGAFLEYLTEYLNEDTLPRIDTG